MAELSSNCPSGVSAIHICWTTVAGFSVVCLRVTFPPLCYLMAPSFCYFLLCLIPSAIYSERLTPVSRSFLCGAMMKFSFLGLPLFFGGKMLCVILLAPTKVGYVTVVTSPSSLGKVTEVTSKATLGPAVGDSPSICGCTLAPRFSGLCLLNILCTDNGLISTGFGCTP